MKYILFKITPTFILKWIALIIFFFDKQFFERKSYDDLTWWNINDIIDGKILFSNEE